MEKEQLGILIQINISFILGFWRALVLIQVASLRSARQAHARKLYINKPIRTKSLKLLDQTRN
ncbi:MAG: hypothetical protein IKY15_01380 [Clostridia bacterium]|nr:hypothetical protein [Clostridia bacterium]